MDKITASVTKTAAVTEEKKGIKGLFKKLKKIKNIELIVAGAVCAVVLLLYFSFSFFPKNEETPATTTFSEYAANLENNLAKILSEIKGAGKVSVMITFESGVEQVFAYTTDTQTNTNSDGVKETSVVYEKSTIVVTGGQPVIVKEIMPLVKGIIVVAEGAGSVSVKLEIMKAVQALFDVPSSKIEIFTKGK